jgi:hypothetical protein
MKTLAALVLIGSSALVANSAAIADGFPVAGKQYSPVTTVSSGYLILENNPRGMHTSQAVGHREPPGTSDAFRRHGGWRVLGSDRNLGHREPPGTSDAFRQQAGSRVRMNTNQIVGHIEPPGTLDAFRQQAGRKIDTRYAYQLGEPAAAHENRLSGG